jgi:signal transduction histidine kinase
VVVRTSGDKRRFLLQVADDGEGMAPDVRDKALTPFFTTRAEGTGLGLPLVQRIVEQHGGSMDIASRAGEGTTVTLLFPPPPRGA